jgi:hypothetical protein
MFLKSFNKYVAAIVGNIRCMLVKSVSDEAVIGLDIVRGEVSRIFWLLMLGNNIK